MQFSPTGDMLTHMDALIRTIMETPSLATLPLRVEEGYLPALITQVTGAMRALAAAGLPVNVRAETLTMEQLARLTDAIYG